MVKSDIVNMIVLKLEISMRAFIVIDVDRQVTLQEIVKPSLLVEDKDMEEEEQRPITEIYRRKWKISWLKLVLLGQV